MQGQWGKGEQKKSQRRNVHVGEIDYTVLASINVSVVVGIDFGIMKS